MNTIKTTNFKWERIDLDKDLFKQKTSSMLIAWASWDALWVPVEMKTKEYIQNQYWRVDNFLDSWLNIFFNKWWLKKWKTGLVSDDTILSFSWVKSIINKWNIDFDDILNTSLEDYKNFPYWFWYWTTSALKRYELLKELYPEIDNYINLWDINSAWNWVIMKQSPYAAYFLAKETKQEVINTNIEILTRLTHNHPTAVVASQVHNQFLMELLKSKWEINLKELLDYLINFAQQQEDKLNKEFEKQDAQKISDLLIKLLEDKQNWGLKSFDEILEKYWWWEQKVYASGYVITTMWIVYSIFLNKQNFEWLLDSINIGWDVDTFWAIIWNMIWAYKWEFYDKYYENWIKDIKKLKTQINNFLDTILKENPKTDITEKEYQEKLEKYKQNQEKIKQDFFKEIKNLNSKQEDIFYNSKWNPTAFKSNVKHLSYAQTLKYWKVQNWYFIVEKPFYIADFSWYIIKKTKIWEKIKFIKLEYLK